MATEAFNGKEQAKDKVEDFFEHKTG